MEPQRPLPPADPKKPSIPRPSGLPTLRKPPVSGRSVGGATSTENLPPPSSLPREKSLVSSSNQGDGDRVLTTDTDSFIIGDTVWVAGTKRGKIAFIGETQFAKGEWAGVVLDEPAGKNDGLVSGIRYFQCEPLHGTFTRLTRLSRKSLFPIDPSKECEVHGATPPRCLVERQRSPSPYTGNSTSPGTTTPGMTTPFRFGGSSPTSAAPLKLGDRVIVQSSTSGTKRGVLRYIGTTEFADGEWAGIELDQPLGKNDGLVQGKRYFSCPASHGLFAPVSKVSSSPSNRRPTSSIRRSGSKESLASNISSVLSTASRSGLIRSLRSVMREMEVHLDQLMQEKEIDRQELAQLNNQLSQRNQEVKRNQASEDLRLEVERYRLELELQKGANEKLVGRLDDLNRKYDDLQFAYEEEKILLSDVQSQLEGQGEGDEELKRLRAELLERTVVQTKVEAELRKSEQMSGEVAAEMEELRGKLRAHEDELAKLKTSEEEMQKLRKEVDDLRRKLEGCTNSEAILTEQKSKFEFEIKELQIAKEELEGELQAAKEKGAENERQKIQIRELEETLKKTSADASAALDTFREASEVERQELIFKTEKLQVELKMTEEKAVAAIALHGSSQGEKEERIKELESKLKSTTEDAKVLVTKVKETSRAELKGKEEELQKLVARMAGLEVELKTAQEKTAALSKENETVQELQAVKEKNHEEKIQGLMQQIQAIKEASALSEANFKSAAEKELQVKEEELQNLASRTVVLEGEVKSGQEKIVALETTQNAKEEKYMAQIHDLESRLSSNEAEFQVSLAKLQEASEGKLDELQKMSTRTAELELKRAEDKAATLVTSHESAQKEREQEYKEKIQEFEKQLLGVESESALFKSGAEKELRGKEEQVQNLVTRSGALEAELRRAEEKVASLIAINESTQNEKEEKYKERIVRLEVQLKSTLEEAAVSASNLQEASRREVKEKEAQIQELKNQLQAVEATSAQSVAHFKTASEEELKKREEELQKLGAKMVGLEVELKTAQEKTAALSTENETVQAEKEGKILELKKQIQAMGEASALSLANLKSTAEKELRVKEEEVQNLKSMTAVLEGEVKGGQEKVIALETAQSAKEGKYISQIHDLESRLSSNEAEFQVSLAKLQEASNGKLDELQKMSSRTSELELELTRAADKAAELISNQQEKELKYTQKIQEFEKQLLAVESESALFKCGAENELKGKEEQVQNFMTRTGVLEAELKRAEEKAASLISINESTQNEKEEKYKERIVGLEAQLKSTLEEAAISTSNLQEASRIEVMEKEKQIQELTNQLQAIETASAESLANFKTASEEELKKKGEELRKNGEELRMKGEELKKKEEELLKILEELKKKGEELQESVSRREALEAELKAAQEKTRALASDHKSSHHDIEIKYNEKIQELEKALAKSIQESAISLANHQASSETQLKPKEEELRKVAAELIAAQERAATLAAKEKERMGELEEKQSRKIKELEERLKKTASSGEQALEKKAAELRKAVSASASFESELIAARDKIRLLSKETEPKQDSRIKELEEIRRKLEAELKAAERAEQGSGDGESQNTRFLNSIIVDLRQKNEQLTQKLEILLTTGEIELADHNRNVTAGYGDGGLNSLASSRLYCDICEEFDLHDTDDCPTQSSEPVDVNSQHHETRGAVREYCATCEVFGHRTENCDAGETY